MMLNAVGISLLLTLGTSVVGALLIAGVITFCYVVDNWPEFKEYAKVVGFLLFVWAFWFALVCASNHHKEQQKEQKAEVENVRAS